MFRHAFRNAVRLPLVLAIVCAGCTSGPVADTPTQRLPVVPPTDLTRHHDAVRDDSPGDLMTSERLLQGYTIVVLGMNGESFFSDGLAPGIVEGGYTGAVDVIDWTTGFWPLSIYHLRSPGMHDAGARAIVDKITAYQALHPHAEVNLIGYSAGAAVILEALEELPSGSEIDRAIFLAAAVSPLHDLGPALSHCRQGIWNYYQPQDVPALWAGTLLIGTADGAHIVSAGAIGFFPPFESETKSLYDAKLKNCCYELAMARYGNLGGHFQCMNRKFAAGWVAPLLTERNSVTPPSVTTPTVAAHYSMPTSPNVSLASRVAKAK